MIQNRKGFTEVVLLLYVIGGLLLFFVPNPVSSSIGIGIKPNKTVQTEKVDLIKDAQGNPIAIRTVTRNDDIQQHVTLWEWLRSLPVIVIVLMGFGVVFPPITIVLAKLWSGLKTETKNIVVSIDHALDNINDPVVKKSLKDNMSKIQDSSTKKLVNRIQGKT